MATTIRTACPEDVGPILRLVNRFAADNVMLPRTEEEVRQTLDDWLIATETQPDGETVVGCGSLVPLTETLVEIRSLAVDKSQHGKGVGSELVEQLVARARERDFTQVCALTLREEFFIRLGFALVDRWRISSKVWQACIYCPKFHRCDEVAVLMNLSKKPETDETVKATEGWNSLLKWREWQPLRLAYQQKPPANTERRDKG